jgi:hypothetical protein
VGQNNAIKLYGGTSATATNNTLFKSIERQTNGSGAIISWTIIYFIDSLTWSSLNYINITGDNSASGVNDSVSCESIVVIPL